MPLITSHEKIATNSRKEIERISFLLSQYCNQYKMSFEDGLSNVMEKAGYKRYNYILYDNDELFTITQLCIRYMKVYSIKPEQFIQTIMNINEYCSKYGYSIDTSQTRLEVNK